THPGKKLLFMGAELGQWREWDHERALDWHLLENEDNQGLQKWLKDLNSLYRSLPALSQEDFESSGFRWVDCGDSEQSVISFLRQGSDKKSFLLAVCNFTPISRHKYMIGVPEGGFWKEVLNSDSENYGGSGQGNLGGLEAAENPCHGMAYSLEMTIPPLGIVVFYR
ncbi:MAG TPA: alpha amylase C-terminal domain-containing protein, partial [Synergistales bacterium]|nr:alpha amylase C-terminal domain-containing protein [Synergistales bacterium]